MTYQTDRQAYKYFCQQHNCSTIRLNSSHNQIIDSFKEVAVRCFPSLSQELVKIAVDQYKEYGGEQVIKVLDTMARNVREKAQAIELEKSIRVTSVQFHESYSDGTLRIKGMIGNDEFNFIKSDGFEYCGCIYTPARAYRYRNIKHEINEYYFATLNQKLDEAVENFHNQSYTKDESGQLELFATEDRQLSLF